MKSTKTTLLFLAFTVLSVTASAQCRSFSKNTCMPKLESYKPNENFNSAMMSPGEEAELRITFYENTDYRLLVCAHPILGAVNYKVLDEEGTILYNNQDHNQSEVFDFQVAGTQELIIEIEVPQRESGNLVHQGCVNIVTGYK